MSRRGEATRLVTGGAADVCDSRGLGRAWVCDMRGAEAVRDTKRGVHREGPERSGGRRRWTRRERLHRISAPHFWRAPAPGHAREGNRRGSAIDTNEAEVYSHPRMISAPHF